jgi:hypothetical protein
MLNDELTFKHFQMINNAPSAGTKAQMMIKSSDTGHVRPNFLNAVLAVVLQTET